MADCIKFPLSCVGTIVNSTVRVTAEISAMVASTMKEDVLHGLIREKLKELIPADVDGEGEETSPNWAISNKSQIVATGGFVKFSMRAATRVQSSRAIALDDRAKRITGDGVEISVVDVDHSPSREVTRQTKQDLRLQLQSAAYQELGRVNELAEKAGQPADYRLGLLDFLQPKTRSKYSERKNYSVFCNRNMENSTTVKMRCVVELRREGRAAPFRFLGIKNSMPFPSGCRGGSAASTETP